MKTRCFEFLKCTLILGHARKKKERKNEKKEKEDNRFGTGGVIVLSTKGILALHCSLFTE